MRPSWMWVASALGAAALAGCGIGGVSDGPKDDSAAVETDRGDSDAPAEESDPGGSDSDPDTDPDGESDALDDTDPVVVVETGDTDGSDSPDVIVETADTDGSDSPDVLPETGETDTDDTDDSPIVEVETGGGSDLGETGIDSPVETGVDSDAWWAQCDEWYDQCIQDGDTGCEWICNG